MKKQHNQYRHKARSRAVGNSWVLPVPKDTILDNIELEEGETLFSTLKDDVKPVISRITVPTPGIISIFNNYLTFR